MTLSRRNMLGLMAAAPVVAPEIARSAAMPSQKIWLIARHNLGDSIFLGSGDFEYPITLGGGEWAGGGGGGFPISSRGGVEGHAGCENVGDRFCAGRQPSPPPPSTIEARVRSAAGFEPGPRDTDTDEHEYIANAVMALGGE